MKKQLLTLFTGVFAISGALAQTDYTKVVSDFTSHLKSVKKTSANKTAQVTPPSVMWTLDWNTGNAAWDSITRNVYTYGVNDQVVRDLEQEYNNSMWENNSFVYNYLNATGYTDSTEAYNWDSNTSTWNRIYSVYVDTTADGLPQTVNLVLANPPIIYFQFNYTYDMNNHPISIVRLMSNFPSPGLSNYDSTAFTTDANFNVLTQEQFSWDAANAVWENVQFITSTYDGNDNEIERIIQDTLGANYVNSERWTETYTVNNDDDVRMYFEWNTNTNTWDHTERDTWTYDANTNILSMLNQSYDGVDYTNVTEELYGYAPIIITSLLTHAANNEFTVYPNPAKEMATINVTLAGAEQIAINVSDITGKHVMNVVNQNLTAGSYKYTVNTDNLNKGMYLIQIQNGKNITTQKLVVN